MIVEYKCGKCGRKQDVIYEAYIPPLIHCCHPDNATPEVSMTIEPDKCIICSEYIDSDSIQTEAERQVEEDMIEQSLIMGMI